MTDDDIAWTVEHVDSAPPADKPRYAYVEIGEPTAVESAAAQLRAALLAMAVVSVAHDHKLSEAVQRAIMVGDDLDMDELRVAKYGLDQWDPRKKL